jgi:peroxiredoxin
LVTRLIERKLAWSDCQAAATTFLSNPAWEKSMLGGVGQKVPAGQFDGIHWKSKAIWGAASAPNAFDIEAHWSAKKIAVFALPGAFTPCSAKHAVPGSISEHVDALHALQI